MTTKIVSDAPTLPIGAPKTADAPYLQALQKETSRELVDHAQAINKLWENIEQNTEYLIPNRTYQGEPIYLQRFSPITGVNGSGGFATATLAHNLPTFYRARYFYIDGVVASSAAATAFPLNFTDPQTGNISHVFVNSVNIGWRVNFNATLHRAHVTLEYQKT